MTINGVWVVVFRASRERSEEFCPWPCKGVLKCGGSLAWPGMGRWIPRRPNLRLYSGSPCVWLAWRNSPTISVKDIGVMPYLPIFFATSPVNLEANVLFGILALLVSFCKASWLMPTDAIIFKLLSGKWEPQVLIRYSKSRESWHQFWSKSLSTPLRRTSKSCKHSEKLSFV